MMAENIKTRPLHWLEAKCRMRPDGIYFDAHGNLYRPTNPSAAAAPVNAMSGEEPIAWRVVTNNTALSFYSTREDADHGAKNRLAYVKGCTSARIEPLYTTPRPSSELVAALREALIETATAGFRSFARGVARKDVGERRMTEKDAERWLKHTVDES
jgi:hypothetical protein